MQCVSVPSLSTSLIFQLQVVAILLFAALLALAPATPTTASAKTRASRVEKTVAKLDGEHRRPCCFNLAACTDPEVSRSGRLIGP